jgi:hypothetical protein
MMLRSLVRLALVATGALLWPGAARAADVPPPAAPAPAWDSSQPAPPGYHVERKVNRGLVLAGSLLFGASYVGIVVPFLIVAANGTGAATSVLLPVVGPLPMVPAQFRGADSPAMVGGMLVLDALLQAAGAGMLIGGMVGKRVLVPGPSRGSAVHLLPVALRLGRNGAGVGLVGAF